MKKIELIYAFKEAKENKNDICVAVTIPGQNSLEYIVNKNESLDNKLDYYLRTYDNNLKHCMNDKIKIVKAFPIDFYDGE